MKRIGAVVVSILLLATTAPAAVESANPIYARADCGHPLVRVYYVHAVDLKHACEGFRRALAVLVDEYGLKLVRPTTITFKDSVELPWLGTRRLRVLGSFDRTTHQIELTTITSMWLKEPDRQLFGLPVDDELHISLVTHEVTHAITKDNYRVANPGFASDEYLAYSVQLATMRRDTLERVLQNYPDLDFKSLTEVTEILHLVRSHEFGVRSFRHFAREGYEYMVDDILSGRFLTFLPSMVK